MLTGTSVKVVFGAGFIIFAPSLIHVHELELESQHILDVEVNWLKQEGILKNITSR